MRIRVNTVGTTKPHPVTAGITRDTTDHAGRSAAGRERRKSPRSDAGAQNGFFYVLDAADGELILGDTLHQQNWTTGEFDENGRPVLVEEA